MSVLDSIPTSETHAAATPGECVHCGLPTARTEVAFCCAGCEAVHEALQSAGLEAGYYRLRNVARRQPAAPARVSRDLLIEEEVDTEWFLDEHTREVHSTLRSTELNLEGVHCAACLWLIEQMPRQVDGVHTARLDLARARLHLQWNPETVRLSRVLRWLAGFGYRAHPPAGETSADAATRERRMLVRLGVAWALAGNVMLIAFALYSGLDTYGGSLASGARWLSMALAVPAVAYGGAPFFSRAFQSIQLALRARSIRPLHMDVPIALGISVGFAHSVYATVSGLEAVWFDSITVLIAALLTARWLQERSRRLAGDAADRLLALVPTMARRVAPGGALQIVRTSALQPGDVVEVPPEEVVPVDGEIISGQSSVNNAVLTGESRPIPAREGSPVHAGAMNLSASIRIRTRAAGDATRVGRLLAWMHSVDTRRAPIVQLADRIGGYFVTAVIALALVTTVLWLHLDPASTALHVTALLVITCPCALGMATPLAMTVATGRAARSGIFVKNEAALQALSEVDTFVLDKTGTLTEGRPVVVERFGDERAIQLAAALERRSTHVLARPIAALSEHGEFVIESVEIRTGYGIRGTVDGTDVVVGKPAWVIETMHGMANGLAGRLDEFASRGLTPVAVAVDGRLSAALGLGDALRTSAESFVNRLHRRGAHVILLSGDRSDVALDVATRLAIPPEFVHADATPEEKHRLISRLQSDGRRVAMIGDGVNDAAALRAADVGIAVGGGTSASLTAADIFLLQEGLAPLERLLAGSHRVMSTVRRNLGFSLIYNLLGASAAIIGVVTPLVAAVAMPLSSLAVVGSSILQRSFRGA